MEISVSQNLVNFVSALDTDRVLDILIIRTTGSSVFSFRSWRTDYLVVSKDNCFAQYIFGRINENLAGVNVKLNY